MKNRLKLLMENKFLLYFFSLSKRSMLFIGFYLLLSNEIFSQSNQLSYSEGLAVKKIYNKDQKGLYGFVNHKGKVVISAVYDTVYSSFRFGFASVGSNKKVGVINKKGKLLIPFEFYEIGEINKPFIPVKGSSGLWGFYNDKGEKITEPQFQNFRSAGKNKIIVQKDGKWGMINHKGDILIEHNYKWIDQLTERNFKLVNTSLWTIRNTSNKVLAAERFDSLKYAGEDLFKFSVIGMHGFMDEKGKVIASPQYDEIGCFRNELVKVRSGKYGVVDKNNKKFIPFEYDDVIIDSLYVRVKNEVRLDDGSRIEKWGLFDFRGNKLISPKYAKMNAFSDGLIAVMREEGTWGYIGTKGNTEIIFRYAYAEDFKDGMAKVLVPYSRLNEKHPAIIDKNGDYIVSPADYYFYTLGLIKISWNKKAQLVIPKDKYSGYEKINDKYVRVIRDGKYGLINTNGKEIVPPVYDYVSAPSEHGFIVVEKEGKSGVIGEYGRFTFRLSTRFDKIYGFHEGYSKILLKGKYGFIDKHGDVWISPQYPIAGEMSDSMVSVLIRGKWGFINNRENLKVQPYYEEVLPFKNGIAIVKENGKWNIINKEGKHLHQLSFNKISETSEGNFLLSIGDRVGLADKKGKEIIAPRFEEITDVGNGYFLVKKNGLWGVLDKKQNFILPFEFDMIVYVPSSNLFITGNTGKQEHIIVK